MERCAPAVIRLLRILACMQIYLLILTLRVILTWFRNINWFSEPWATLRQVCARAPPHACAPGSGLACRAAGWNAPLAHFGGHASLASLRFASRPSLMGRGTDWPPHAVPCPPPPPAPPPTPCCAPQFTDPFLSVFRGIVPSLGGIDLSPMLGFFLLNFARTQLVHLSRTMV